MKELNINNRKVTIFCDSKKGNKLPLVILNSFNNEGKSVWEECKNITTKNFSLVAIEIDNWNDDLTPWECPPLYKGDEKCLGYADKYLKELETTILKEVENYLEEIGVDIEYYVIAGYSLAGLFALYASYKTNIFKKVASASGSFWYPNFLEYVKENKISKNIEKIYLSLGNKEKETKNKILQKVEENTLEIYNILNKNISCIYEENEGNHFKDTTKRMAKAIRNILED